MEALLLEKFKLQVLPFLKTIPQTQLEWMALGQHHGLATRLLDWTENPLAALFFAVNNSHEFDGVVWAISVRMTLRDKDISLSRLDQHELDAKLYRYNPPHTTNRITAQKGFFTIQAIPDSIDKVVPLDTHFLTLNVSPDYILKKLIVSGQQKKYLKYELDKLGIDYYSLYPDIDGLCQRLNWQIQMVDGLSN